jgi:hypothetical protein
MDCYSGGAETCGFVTTELISYLIDFNWQESGLVLELRWWLLFLIHAMRHFSCLFYMPVLLTEFTSNPERDSPP